MEIQPITQETDANELKKVDFIFGGGAQDREQEIVMRDLHTKKGEILKQRIEHGVPALFVCGSPQLMGNYYEPGFGKQIKGLGIFDMESRHPGLNKQRLIGNIVAKIANPIDIADTVIAGFENHGGRTILGKNAKPFAKVIKGFGNNGEDGTEGVVYKNAIGCYFHGPFLPKNPQVADYLIKKALEIKYKKEVILEPLDDTLEKKALHAIAHRLDVKL